MRCLQPLPGASSSPRPALGGCRLCLACQSGDAGGTPAGGGQDWGLPSLERTIPSPQLPNVDSLAPTVDRPPPSIPDGSDLSKLLFLIPLGLKRTKTLPKHPFWGSLYFFLNNNPPHPMLLTSIQKCVCLVLWVNEMWS